MTRLLWCLISATTAFTGCSARQRPDAKVPAAAEQISRAGTQAPMIGPVEWFTGRVRIEPLFPPSEDINASAAYVTFAPGARSAWHTQPAGQRLVVTSGVGLTQEWGRPVQVMRPGDVVFCSPGVKHWHGAAPTHAMIHLAVTGSSDGKLVTWMEKVTDEHYNAAGAATAAAPPPPNRSAS